MEFLGISWHFRGNPWVFCHKWIKVPSRWNIVDDSCSYFVGSFATQKRTYHLAIWQTLTNKLTSFNISILAEFQQLTKQNYKHQTISWYCKFYLKTSNTWNVVFFFFEVFGVGLSLPTMSLCPSFWQDSSGIWLKPNLMNLQCYGQLHLVRGSDPLKSNETTKQNALGSAEGLMVKTETNFPEWYYTKVLVENNNPTKHHFIQFDLPAISLSICLIPKKRPGRPPGHGYLQLSPAILNFYDQLLSWCKGRYIWLHSNLSI